MTSLAMWTVYDHPKDYPDKYVARRFDVLPTGEAWPSDSIMITDTLEHMREIMVTQLHLVCLTRNEDDDPKIVETWL
jgi:hypothetical protein